MSQVVEAPRDRMDSHSRILALQALGASTTTDDFLCIESVAAAAKHDETDVRKAAVKCLGSLKAESGGKSHPRIARKLLPLLQVRIRQYLLLVVVSGGRALSKH